MIRLSVADAKRLKLPAKIVSMVKDAARMRLGGFLAWRQRPSLSNFKLKPEESVQLAIMDFLRLHLRKDACAYHPPNEAIRSKATWAMLYGLGFWRGMPDIVIYCQGRAYFIEVKSDSGELTSDQEDFISWATASGFPCIVAREIGPVSEFLTAHQLRAF